ncbi:MAG: ATP-grasp domain-containing protein, partial [Deltaproteobacteria bacterium]|nr:ATP-grasp domain-containing protein [Deltaproteobacteria bacterium]
MDGLFDNIFISSRGEVANRIARTCRRVGIDVLDVELPPTPHPLLPDAEATVAAAQAAGATALHPGYVGPRARAELAFLSRAAGLTFVGPSNEALAVMADKVALRTRAEATGIKALPGSAALSTWDEARDAAQELEFPLFVKPVAGTAGFGVLEVDDEDDLHNAFDISIERATATFGDGRVYLEHALHRPRHLEVTVVADAHGNRFALRERDSSVQRRHQVLIAETPSPWLSNHGEGEAIREFLIDQALRLAEELSLVGVFTVEFLIDADDRVFFLEANADMQGAILVTELATGRDPIELSLEVATGAPLTDDPS